MIDAPRDVEWHHFVGEAMVTSGIFSAIIISVKAMRRNRGRR
jgi:hypothetical protein